MTPISLGLILVGLSTFFWPLATLLFKRHVLDAQWLMMLALTMTGASFILLGCLFNNFLKGEYLIQMLFFDVILITPPIIHVALSVLTQPQASSLSVRVFFLPSLLCIALMIISVAIGGHEMYLRWASRGLEGMSGVFFPNSWRYNLIVAVNFYLFWALFFFQFFYVFIVSIRQYLRFKRINSEYFTSDRFYSVNLKRIFLASNLGMLVMFIGMFTNPFVEEHTLLFYLTYCLPLALIAFYLGRSIYMINNSAERIPLRKPGRRDTAALAKQLVEYIEKQQAFLNPDLSVFMLAKHFHTSEDDIIDAIHHFHGSTFADYIDALRIERASLLLTTSGTPHADLDSLSQLAHQCGFADADTLRRTFRKVMHTSLSEDLLDD